MTFAPNRLGFRIDESATAAAEPRLTQKWNTPLAWIIPANDERTIAREALQAMTGA